MAEAQIEARQFFQRQADEATRSLAKLREAQILEAGIIAADIAGLADPTPASDGVSMGLSLAKGDYWGAGLSLLSMVPYAGDIIAKPIKAVKATRTGRKLAAAVAKATKQLNTATSALRTTSRDISKKAAEIIRKKRAAAPPRGTCRYGSRIPAKGKGKWAGQEGNSTWTSKAGHTVPYENGYPNFERAKNADGESAFFPGGKVEIKMTGKKGTDFTAANRAMKEKFPDWKGTPDGYVWHHAEDGATMVLVEKKVHNAVEGAAGTGSAHTGGVSIVKDGGF